MNVPFYFLAFVAVLVVLRVTATRAKAQEITLRIPMPEIPTIPRLKTCIQTIEKNPRHHVGDAGERGIYSMMPYIWAKWSFRPFNWASSDRPDAIAETERVMSCELAYIRGLILRDGYPHTVYFVGCIYKGGETRWNQNTLRAVDTDYAKRLANLYAATP